MSVRGLLKLAAALGIVVAGFVMPFAALGTARTALTNALVAISLVVLTGWIGQISLAQAAFVGIGAYITALTVNDYGLGFPLTVLVGALVAMGAATLLGLVALRVRGLYLAVATLIFAWMAQDYLFNLPQLVGSGGSALANTPPLGEEGSIPFLDFTDRQTFYFVMLAVVAGAILAMANLRDSKTGRAFFAVKGSEVAAASLGIDVTRAKLAAFAVAGFLAGLAGALFMTHRSVASISQFTVEQSLFYLSVAVVGGLTSLGGAVASGALFASLDWLFFEVDVLDGFLLLTSALLLAVVLLFFPAGLAGIPSRVRALVERAGLRGFLARTRVTYRELRGREGPLEAAAAEEDSSDEERAGEAATVGQPGEEPAKAAVVEGDTGADGSDGRLVRFVDAARRFLPIARSQRDNGASRDALLESIVAEEERIEAEVEASAGSAEGLAYVPGTAKKVRLPARSKRRPVLAARDITVQFGGLTAVDSFDLEVRQGEITALIGPNGAGKTTLFNAISGLNQPTTGSVDLYGYDVSTLPVHQRARLGMGRTFQVLQLFPELSVFENLMVATHQRNPTGFFAHLAATNAAVGWEAASRERVAQVVELIGLEEEADEAVANLPFGRLRLVELARALVTGSPFVMLDEPASGLDNTETDRFMDLLLWVRERLGVTMLLIEHDMRVVMGLADHAYVIDRGQKISEGTTKKIQKDKKVIAAYLGTAPADVEGDDEPDEAGDESDTDKAGKKSRQRTRKQREKTGAKR